jgi:hypothetical protein
MRGGNIALHSGRRSIRRPGVAQPSAAEPGRRLARSFSLDLKCERGFSGLNRFRQFTNGHDGVAVIASNQHTTCGLVVIHSGDSR